MNKKSLMQRALGKQWQQLPPALQAHYQLNDNSDKGELDIEYPFYMQPYLSFLRLFGVLINRKGKNIHTIVEKVMQGDVQYWKRSIFFSDEKVVLFKSFWIHDKNNELIEFVNPFVGLRMRVYVDNNSLYYDGICFVIKLRRFMISVPEWLVLGHTSIVESVLSDSEFKMDFKLRHPLFGVIFRYSGRFKTF